MKLKTQLLAIAIFSLSVSGCTPAKRATGLGATTGALVGGGLGAVVGNQTGNAGSGALVGALTGAAAGTIIGNKFDEQQATLDAQKVEIERVKAESQSSAAELRTHKRQINAHNADASHSVTDAYKKARPVSAERGRYGWSGSNSAPVAKKSSKTVKQKSSSSSYKKSSSYKSSSSHTKSAKKSAPVSRREIEVVPQIMPPAPAKPVVPKVPSVDQAAADAQAAIDNAPAAIPMPETPKVEAPKIDVPAEVEKLDTTPPTAIDPFADFDDVSKLDKGSGSTDGQPLGAYKWGGSKECAQAGADKLYHFRRAIRLCPGKAEFHKMLGDTYTSMGRKLDAEFELGEAQRLEQ
jgi:hypothetical protein